MATILQRLRNPPFGTETSERYLMVAAADLIEQQEVQITSLKRSLRACSELLKIKNAHIAKLENNTTPNVRWLGPYLPKGD